jgi:hypothetical protein
MKIEKYLNQNTPKVRYDREKIDIEFSKSGVTQTWNLFFNKGRLLTNEVFTSYNPNTQLRTTEKCVTLEDVLRFLYQYSYSPTYVRIASHTDLLGSQWGYLPRLKALLDVRIDFNKLYGCVYFGRHTITFSDGYVNFLFKNSVNDGTYKLTGKRDLLKLTNKLVGNLQNDIDFLLAVKKLEQS